MVLECFILQQNKCNPMMCTTYFKRNLLIALRKS